MTQKTLLYRTKAIRDLDIPIQASQGWSSKHLNNRGIEFEVIYDNTPSPPRPPNRQLTESEYVKEIALRDFVDIV